MNGIFKLVVIALMGALFAAGHRDSGDAARFQTAAVVETSPALAHLR